MSESADARKQYMTRWLRGRKLSEESQLEWSFLWLVKRRTLLDVHDGLFRLYYYEPVQFDHFLTTDERAPSWGVRHDDKWLEYFKRAMGLEPTTLSLGS